MPNDAAVDLITSEYDWRKYLPDDFEIGKVLLVLKWARGRTQVFPVKSKEIVYALLGYVLYNEELILSRSVFYENTCKLVDLSEEIRNIEETDGITEGDVELLEAKLDRAYPISIRIMPGTSQRDVVSFIRGVWSDIERLQKTHARKSKKLGKLGKAVVRERNLYIFENRKLPAKKIVSKVIEKYGEILDYSYISKIIASEKKRRKQV